MHRFRRASAPGLNKPGRKVEKKSRPTEKKRKGLSLRGSKKALQGEIFGAGERSKGE